MGAPGALRSEYSGCSQWTPRACGYPHTFCGWTSMDLPWMFLQAHHLFPAWIPLTNLRNSFCTNKPPSCHGHSQCTPHLGRRSQVSGLGPLPHWTLEARATVCTHQGRSINNFQNQHF